MRPPAVHINLIWGGGNSADDEAIAFFMQAEFIEQRYAFEDMGKRILFIYFSDSLKIRCQFLTTFKHYRDQ